jgi:hypothetical protein
MNDFADALYTAAGLIGHFDAELREIVSLLLGVSLTASICAFVMGSPVGAALGMYRFRGRGAIIVVANALLGLVPPATTRQKNENRKSNVGHRRQLHFGLDADGLVNNST